MGTAGRGGQSVTSARAATGIAQHYEVGMPGARVGVGVYSGARTKKARLKKLSLDELLGDIRRFFRTTAGRDKDLALLLSSNATRRCYELIFDFLFKANSVEELKGSLKLAGADSEGDWQYDVKDWMKRQVEEGVQSSGDDPTHLDWALSVLEQTFVLMLPAHDLYADPPSLQEMQKYCAGLKPENVAEAFFAQLLYHLLDYHFSHVSTLMPEVPIGMIQQDLVTACQRIADEAYMLRPKNVDVSRWFKHVQENIEQYVKNLVKERKPEAPEKEEAA